MILKNFIPHEFYKNIQQENIKQLVENELDEKVALQLLSLLTRGRYATTQEIDAKLFDLKIDRFKVWKLLRPDQKPFDVHLANPSYIYAEVTHTLNYGKNSGIQRVVRQFAEEATRLNAKIKFIHFNCGVIQELTESDQERLLNFRYARKNQQARKLEIALRKVGQIVWEDLRYLGTRYFDHFKKLVIKTNRGKDLYRKLEGFFEERAARKIRDTNPVFLYQAKLFIPELVDDPKRLKTYCDILTTIPVKSSMIVYDFIPLLMPEVCVVSNFSRYTRLLGLINNIIPISHTVEKDVVHFLSFISREEAPSVQTILLPGLNSAKNLDHKVEPNSPPKVVCVGTIEPRKNQINVLRASVLLKKEDIPHELYFLGTSGWRNEEFYSLLNTLEDKEHVHILTDMDDEILINHYKSSRFTVFCSVLEGYGLPIVESLQFKKPVITSNIGSMREIAQSFGGCELVDPYSVESIKDSMKSLLVSDEQYNKLVSEIKMPPSLSWSSYAEEVLKSLNSF